MVAADSRRISLRTSSTNLSQSKLAKVMVRVPVRPTLPVCDRHGAEKPVRRLEAVRSSRRNALETRDCSRQVSGELRWLGAIGSWIVQRIGRPAMGPRNRNPKSQPSHNMTAAAAHRFSPRSAPQHHRGGITKVTQHFVRRERSPAATAVGSQGTETTDERTQDVGIRNRLHRPSSKFRWYCWCCVRPANAEIVREASTQLFASAAARVGASIYHDLYVRISRQLLSLPRTCFCSFKLCFLSQLLFFAEKPSRSLARYFQKWGGETMF